MSRVLPETELLLEIGHVALANGLVEDALAIMEGLALLEPDDPHPRIGRALAHHVSGQRSQAIEDLRETIAHFPNAVFARSLLARFMKMSGLSGWDEVVHEVLSMDPPQFVADLARDLLDEEATVVTSFQAERDISAGSDSGNRAISDQGFPAGFRGRAV